MATDKDEIPPKIKSLNAHGCNLEPGADGSADWQGDCPFCGRRNKFFANHKKGMWDCKSCGKEGNVASYLTQVTDHYAATMGKRRLAKLSDHRDLPMDVLKSFRIGWDEADENYMIPCYSQSGVVHDIRRYNLKRKKLMCTPGCKSQLFNARALKNARAGTRVWLCEGEWDAMAMQWLLNMLKKKDDVVVSVPGAKNLKKQWVTLFADMNVVACYDNDEPGDEGARKAHKLLRRVSRSMKFVSWSDSLKPGYDIRDFVKKSIPKRGAKKTMVRLENLLGDLPRHVDATEVAAEDKPAIAKNLPPLVKMNAKQVIQVFREELYMTDEMEDILKMMLAVCMSNDVKSDPIWLYIVGPPGAGKTLLLTAFQASDRCLFRSTLTPASLVSGWKGEDGDPSLIPKLAGRTLIAKDFTEILDMPSMAQDEIFSTLRGAYDGHVQKSFGNGVIREYHDVSFSILAGVTHAIHGHRKAHLGERFLRFEMRDLDEAHMDKVLSAAIDSIGTEHKKEIRLQHAVASFLQKKIKKPPPLEPSVKKKIHCLVKLVAVLRSQVERDPRTGEVTYRPRAELGTRLAKQLAKLASMLAFVDEKKTADDSTYAQLMRVAYDTVGGYSLDIVDALIEMGGRGTRMEVADKIKASSSTLHRRFEDLELVGAIFKDKRTEIRGGIGRPSAVWEVTDEIAKLWTTAKGMTKWKKTASIESTNSKSSTRKSARRLAQTSRGLSPLSRKEAKRLHQRRSRS